MALASTGVPRADIFVTSKVDTPYGYNTTVGHIAAVLATLNQSYVDLLLIHCARPRVRRRPAARVRAMGCGSGSRVSGRGRARPRVF